MNKRGFSLTEILLVLALLMITGGLVSQFGAGLYQKNEALVIRDQVINAFEFARMQALARQETLYLSSLNRNDNWSEGMALYSLNPKGLPNLIHQWPWNHPQWQILWQGVKGGRQIPVSPQLGQSLSDGRFILKNKQGRQVTLVISRIGRIRLEEDTP